MSAETQAVRTGLWTGDERALLRRMVKTERPAAIAARLGRTENSIKTQMYHMRLKGPVQWSAEEDALLLAVKRLPIAELVERMGRSKPAVYRRLRELGAALGFRGRWSAEEDEKLRGMAWTMSWKLLAAEFGRSVFSLQRRVELLGVKSPRWWSAAEDAVILAGGSNAPMRELMERTGRGYNSVWNRRRELGVAPGTKRKWLEREVEQLRREVGQFDAETIAARVGRTVSSVVHKAEELGLRAPGFRAKRCVSIERRKRTAPRPKRVMVEVARVVYCQVCSAPVVNTFEGWAGHNQRMGCNRKAVRNA